MTSSDWLICHDTFRKSCRNAYPPQTYPRLTRIIAEETMLTIYNDGSAKNNNNQNICIAFTVDDMDREYQKVLKSGAEVIEKPIKRPWGAVNMSFYDPDRNVVYLRSFER